MDKHLFLNNFSFSSLNSFYVYLKASFVKLFTKFDTPVFLSVGLLYENPSYVL